MYLLEECLQSNTYVSLKTVHMNIWMINILGIIKFWKIIIWLFSDFNALLQLIIQGYSTFFEVFNLNCTTFLENKINLHCMLKNCFARKPNIFWRKKAGLNVLITVNDWTETLIIKTENVFFKTENFQHATQINICI